MPIHEANVVSYANRLREVAEAVTALGQMLAIMDATFWKSQAFDGLLSGKGVDGDTITDSSLTLAALKDFENKLKDAKAALIDQSVVSAAMIYRNYITTPLEATGG